MARFHMVLTDINLLGRIDGWEVARQACCEFVIALAFASAVQAAVTALGIIIATVSAAAIQLWFRVRASAASFAAAGPRHGLATFAEAFCSIRWAATARPSNRLAKAGRDFCIRQYSAASTGPVNRHFAHVSFSLQDA